MKTSKLFLLSLFSLMLSGTAWAGDTGSTEQTGTATLEASTSTDVALPSASKFYTLQCVTSGNYVLSTLSKKEGFTDRLATAAATDDNAADRIFFFCLYSEKGVDEYGNEDFKHVEGCYNLIGYNDGYWVDNTTSDSSPFAGHAEAGAVEGSVFSFGSADVSEGSLYVNFNNGGRGLKDSGEGYVDAGDPNNTGDGYRFKLTEVTELPLTIGSNGWSSFSVPKPVEIPEGVTVYYAASAPSEGKLMLTELTGGVIPNDMGVLVQGKEGATVYFKVADLTSELDPSLKNTNHLVSNWYVSNIGDSEAESAKTDGLYAFATKTNNDKTKTTGFMKLLTQITLPGHKCYLDIYSGAEGDGGEAEGAEGDGGGAEGAEGAAAGSPQFLPITLADDPTGIESAETATVSDSEAPIYDLQGRKVSATTKGGMYIQNGKVFLAM